MAFGWNDEGYNEREGWTSSESEDVGGKHGETLRRKSWDQEQE